MNSSQSSNHHHPLSHNPQLKLHDQYHLDHLSNRHRRFPVKKENRKRLVCGSKVHFLVFTSTIVNGQINILGNKITLTPMYS